jgi:hypothetical protein
VSTAKVFAEPVWRNAIAYIAAAFMPRPVFVFPVLCTVTPPDIAVRRIVPVFARVFVRWPVMRLMNFWPVCLLLVLGRTYVVPRFGPIRLVIVAMLRRSLVAVVVRVVPLMMFGTAVVVSASVVFLIMPVISVGRSACC